MDHRHKWERENKVLEEGMGEKLHGLEGDVDFNRTQTLLLTKSQNIKGQGSENSCHRLGKENPILKWGKGMNRHLLQDGVLMTSQHVKWCSGPLHRPHQGNAQ